MSFVSSVTKERLHKLGKDKTIDPSRASVQELRNDIKKGLVPRIPSPEIFVFPPRPSVDADHSTQLPLPSSAEIATHLELLETLFFLRQRILTSKETDNAFKIKSWKYILRDKDLTEKRQIKWMAFVKYAVARFLEWRKGLGSSLNYQDFLPPSIDILMVWHTFVLNPELFHKHCKDEPLYWVPLPWGAIHSAIDNLRWIYKREGSKDAGLEQEKDLRADLFPDFVENHEEPSQACDDDKTKSLASELCEAVLRQCKFVDVMNQLLWIQSPALRGTLRRAVDRYEKFLKIFQIYPGFQAVPTPDIDIVWHTHLCNAGYYRGNIQGRIGILLNHDDTVGEEDLKEGFSNTKRRFQFHFLEEYERCGCWDCEMLLDCLEEAAGSNPGKVDMDMIAEKVAKEVESFREMEVATRTIVEEWDTF